MQKFIGCDFHSIHNYHTENQKPNIKIFPIISHDVTPLVILGNLILHLLIRDYPNSIENYISYFTEHYNNVKNTYTAVCDFSNANVNLSQSFLESISKKLLENFEIKVTFQFRDPIRRFFSETGSLFTGSSKVYKDFMEKLYTERKKHKKLFFYFLRNQYFNPNCEYVDLYKKYSSVFGKENCYYIIMEDFWDDKQRDVQLDKLSNFLNYKITKILNY